MKTHTRNRRSRSSKLLAAGLSAAWLAGIATLFVTASAAHAF